MSLVWQLLKTLGIWLIALIFVILVVLIPRDTTMMHFMPVEFSFSFQEYKQNILLFFHQILREQSLGYNRLGLPVEHDIILYMPASLALIMIAMSFSMFIGITKGIYDFRGIRKGNHLRQGMTWLFQSVPDFLLILIIHLTVISLWHSGLLPSFRLFSNEMWYNYVIVGLLLSFYPTLYIARITASTLANQEDQPYIQTAIAKGLYAGTILYKHMLGNCWASILSHLPTIVLYMLSNLLIVEYLMFFPGAANRLYQALGFHRPEGYIAATYEPNVVIGLAFCFMLLVLLAQVISQLARYAVDPRVREEEQG